MTNEEIKKEIEAVEKLKANCEEWRDKALALYVDEDADAGYWYLGWVEKVEACERELKRLRSEYAKNVLEERQATP